MAARELAAAEAGFPDFAPPEQPAEPTAEVFSLSSHARAREALDFGLSTREPGFNIFVVGENRSGRMTATLAWLKRAMEGQSRPSDWVYLNNFRRPNEPVAIRLPAGEGRRLREAMGDLIPNLREALHRAFTREEYQQRVGAENQAMRGEVNEAMEAARKDAEAVGLSIVQTAQGLTVAAVDEEGNPRDVSHMPEDERRRMQETAESVRQKLAELGRLAARRQGEFAERMRDFNREVASAAVSDLIDAFAERFGDQPGLARWLTAFRVDVLENLSLFAGGDEDGEGDGPPVPGRVKPTAEERYAVNLFVDNADARSPRVVVEANPTYENLFGRIEYRQVAGVLQTDFSLIQPGALHRANGGILVLRAEALAASRDAWVMLKGAMRDGVIKMEEMHRSGGVPIAGAPSPHPIPFEVKVVVIGAPQWYYAYFSIDHEFQTYFKVKAEIDADMAADAANVATYSGLIQTFAHEHGAATCTPDAVSYLLGYASRLAFDRDKLSARFELIEDIVAEAVHAPGQTRGVPISREAVAGARLARRNRNARVEDRVQEAIRRGTVMIATTGTAVGQVNGLTVRDTGDHAFGTPARVTARTSIGRRGVTNIERETLLGGPIQQKGAMVIQGFLAGHFARRLPLSFNASITFEQSYGGVEGDSASLAELLAIVSDLADAPLRQDLAVTGSVNQRGEVQAIGGLTHKFEGFYRTCREAASLTGTQGVVFPRSNEPNLVLDADVVAAMEAGQFHAWSVALVDEAIELFTGIPAGTPDGDGVYPADSIYGRIAARLIEFDRILDERDHHD